MPLTRMLSTWTMPKKKKKERKKKRRKKFDAARTAPRNELLSITPRETQGLFCNVIHDHFLMPRIPSATDIKLENSCRREEGPRTYPAHRCESWNETFSKIPFNMVFLGEAHSTMRHHLRMKSSASNAAASKEMTGRTALSHAVKAASAHKYLALLQATPTSCCVIFLPSLLLLS